MQQAIKDRRGQDVIVEDLTPSQIFQLLPTWLPSCPFLIKSDSIPCQPLGLGVPTLRGMEYRSNRLIDMPRYFLWNVGLLQ
jgi:hypothetical protein